MVFKPSVKKWKQTFIPILGNFPCLAVGVCYAWSSPSTVKLTSNEDTPLQKPLNADEIGWVTSFTSLGAAFGPVFVWLLLDRIGRKWTLMLSTMIFTIATFLLIFVHQLWAIYVARIFHGFTLGIGMAAQPIYNGEVATKDFRGALSTIMPLLYLLTFICVSVIGTLVSYTTIQWITLPFCFFYPAVFYFVPDTPHYHIKKGNFDKAIETLKYLRDKSETDVLDEYENIKKSVEESFNMKTRFLDLFKQKRDMKGLFITLGLITFQQLLGISVVMYNVEGIVLSTKAITPLLFLLSMGIVQIITTLITIYLIEKIGRRTLLIISSIPMSISLIVLGVYFNLLKNSENDISNLKWLPITALFILLITFSIGYSPVPWIIVSEIFSPNIKSFASSLNVFLCWIISFIMSKLYPIINEKYGLDIVMWMYGLFGILASIFIILFVFETKGMTLDEIQLKLSKKKNEIQ